MQYYGMEWIFLALGAHFLWGISNIGDKFVVGKRVQNPYIYTILFKYFSLPVLVMVPFLNVTIPSVSDMTLLAVTALCFFLGGFPYIKAVQMEEISRINVWWGLNPIFALLIEILILGKQFTSGEMIGFAILMVATVLASIHFSSVAFKVSKAVWLMVVATFLFAVYGILAGVLLETMSFGQVFFWVTLWMAIWSTVSLVIPGVARRFVTECKGLKKGDYAFITFLAIISVVGIAAQQLAFTFAPVSFVFSLEGSQAIMVFVSMALISTYAPHLMKEETDKKNVLVKVLAVIVMAIGVAVLKLT